MLRLTIRLRVEGGTYPGFNTNEFKEILLKPRRKARIPIGDNILRYTV